MRENKMKTKLREGKVVVGVTTDLRDPNIVEIIAYAGYDFVQIDMEHQARDWQNLENMIRAAEFADITPIVRIPEMNESYVLRALEMGVMGVTVPHVRTKKEAVRAVRACKYAPKGIRGVHTCTRANKYRSIPFAQHVKEANDQTFVCFIIEDMEGVRNIDEIVTVEGLDAIFLGPSDLACELEVPGEWTHPRVKKELDKVVEATRKVKGLGLCQFIIDPTKVKEWVNRGVNIVMSYHDTHLLTNAYKQNLQQITDAMKS